MQKIQVLKSHILFALSLALAAPLAQSLAQAPPPPMHGPMGGPMHGGYGGHGGGRMQRMSDELGLTDVQKSKMMPILMGSRQQMEAVRNNPKLTPTAQMAKMAALRKSSNMQIMAILTPAQRVKMKTMMSQRPGGYGGPHPGGYGSPRP